MIKSYVAERLRRAIKDRGFDLHRQEAQPSALDLLHLVVEAHRDRVRSGWTVQVGANDGVSGDSLGELVRRFELQAALIEPVPETVARLRENYGDQPSVRVVHGALAAEEGSCELWVVRGSNLPQVASQWASFERDVVERNCRTLEVDYTIEQLEVPAVTFQSLTRAHGIDSIALLHVDTEGFDDQVILMALDAGLLPDFIHYEYVHLSTTRRNLLTARLESAGYHTATSGRDRLAVHSSVSPAAPSPAGEG